MAHNGSRWDGVICRAAGGGTDGDADVLLHGLAATAETARPQESRCPVETDAQPCDDHCVPAKIDLDIVTVE